MNNFEYFVMLFTCSIISFLIGWFISPKMEKSDWNLAYEHWYETSAMMLENDSLLNDLAMIEDLDLAQREIDSVRSCMVVDFPVICDQRDKLSDAIRAYADSNPESDIMEYVSNYGICPHQLQNWVYSY